MNKTPKGHHGFSLIELIAVMILLGIVSVTLFSRLGVSASASVLGSRDDVIAALSLAQQLAMARDGIKAEFTSNRISVTQAGTPLLKGSNYYPLSLPANVQLTPSRASFAFDKLGRTTAGSVLVQGAGASALVVVEASGYAHAN